MARSTGLKLPRSSASYPRPQRKSLNSLSHYFLTFSPPPLPQLTRANLTLDPIPNSAKRYERLLKAHDIQPPKNYGSLTDDVGASGASSPAKAKTPRAPRSTKRKRATATVNYNEDSGNEDGSGDNREPFTYKAEPEDSDDEEKQRPLKKEKTTPEMQTKQEEEDDGESDYFSCCSDDVDLLDEEDAAYGWEGNGYDVLMDVVGRIEGEDNYKYEGEI